MSLDILLDPFAIGAAVGLALLAITFGVIRHERPSHIALQAIGIGLWMAALRWSTFLLHGDEFTLAAVMSVATGIWVMGAERARAQRRLGDRYGRSAAGGC